MSSRNRYRPKKSTAGDSFEEGKSKEKDGSKSKDKFSAMEMPTSKVFSNGVLSKTNQDLHKHDSLRDPMGLAMAWQSFRNSLSKNNCEQLADENFHGLQDYAFPIVMDPTQNAVFAKMSPSSQANALLRFQEINAKSVKDCDDLNKSRERTAKFMQPAVTEWDKRFTVGVVQKSGAESDVGKGRYYAAYLKLVEHQKTHTRQIAQDLYDFLSKSMSWNRKYADLFDVFQFLDLAIQSYESHTGSTISSEMRITHLLNLVSRSSASNDFLQTIEFARRFWSKEELIDVKKIQDLLIRINDDTVDKSIQKAAQQKSTTPAAPKPEQANNAAPAPRTGGSTAQIEKEINDGASKHKSSGKSLCPVMVDDQRCDEPHTRAEHSEFIRKTKLLKDRRAQSSGDSKQAKANAVTLDLAKKTVADSKTNRPQQQQFQQQQQHQFPTQYSHQHQMPYQYYPQQFPPLTMQQQQQMGYTNPQYQQGYGAMASYPQRQGFNQQQGQQRQLTNAPQAKAHYAEEDGRSTGDMSSDQDHSNHATEFANMVREGPIRHHLNVTEVMSSYETFDILSHEPIYRSRNAERAIVVVPSPESIVVDDEQVCASIDNIIVDAPAHELSVVDEEQVCENIQTAIVESSSPESIITTVDGRVCVSFVDNDPLAISAIDQQLLAVAKERCRQALLGCKSTICDAFFVSRVTIPDRMITSFEHEVDILAEQVIAALEERISREEQGHVNEPPTQIFVRHENCLTAVLKDGPLTRNGWRGPILSRITFIRCAIERGAVLVCRDMSHTLSANANMSSEEDMMRLLMSDFGISYESSESLGSSAAPATAVQSIAAAASPDAFQSIQSTPSHSAASSTPVNDVDVESGERRRSITDEFVGESPHRADDRALHIQVQCSLVDVLEIQCELAEIIKHLIGSTNNMQEKVHATVDEAISTGKGQQRLILHQLDNLSQRITSSEQLAQSATVNLMRVLLTTNERMQQSIAAISNRVDTLIGVIEVGRPSAARFPSASAESSPPRSTTSSLAVNSLHQAPPAPAGQQRLTRSATSGSSLLNFFPPSAEDEEHNLLSFATSNAFMAGENPIPVANAASAVTRVPAIYDSGASATMICSDEGCTKSSSQAGGKNVVFGGFNGEPGMAKSILARVHRPDIGDALVVQGLKQELLSVSKLGKYGRDCLFTRGRCYLYDRDSLKVLSTGTEKQGLYYSDGPYIGQMSIMDVLLVKNAT